MGRGAGSGLCSTVPAPSRVVHECRVPPGERSGHASRPGGAVWCPAPLQTQDSGQTLRVAEVFEYVVFAAPAEDPADWILAKARVPTGLAFIRLLEGVLDLGLAVVGRDNLLIGPCPLI